MHYATTSVSRTLNASLTLGEWVSSLIVLRSGDLAGPDGLFKADFVTGQLRKGTA